MFKGLDEQLEVLSSTPSELKNEFDLLQQLPPHQWQLLDLRKGMSSTLRHLEAKATACSTHLATGGSSGPGKHTLLPQPVPTPSPHLSEYLKERKACWLFEDTPYDQPLVDETKTTDACVSVGETRLSHSPRNNTVRCARPSGPFEACLSHHPYSQVPQE